MSVFVETIQERLSQEHRSLDHARATSDLYQQAVHETELDHLHRIALSHGVPCHAALSHLAD